MLKCSVSSWCRVCLATDICPISRLERITPALPVWLLNLVVVLVSGLGRHLSFVGLAPWTSPLTLPVLTANLRDGLLRPSEEMITPLVRENVDSPLTFPCFTQGCPNSGEVTFLMISPWHFIARNCEPSLLLATLYLPLKTETEPPGLNRTLMWAVLVLYVPVMNLDSIVVVPEHRPSFRELIAVTLMASAHPLPTTSTFSPSPYRDDSVRDRSVEYGRYCAVDKLFDAGECDGSLWSCEYE